MEIQRQPNGHLEINLDAASLEAQKGEIARLGELLGNWQKKAESAKSCSIQVTCDTAHAGELKPLVEEQIANLNDSLSIPVKLDSISSRKKPVDANLAQKKSHLKDLFTLASVDGSFDQEEQEFIYEVGSKMGFSNEQVDSIYNESVLVPDQIESVNPPDKAERMQQLTNLCRLILADGKIDDWESVLIFPFAVRMGFEPGEVSKLLKKMVEEETS